MDFWWWSVPEVGRFPSSGYRSRSGAEFHLRNPTNASPSPWCWGLDKKALIYWIPARHIPPLSSVRCTPPYLSDITILPTPMTVSLPNPSRGRLSCAKSRRRPGRLVPINQPWTSFFCSPFYSPLRLLPRLQLTFVRRYCNDGNSVSQLVETTRTGHPIRTPRRRPRILKSVPTGIYLPRATAGNDIAKFEWLLRSIWWLFTPEHLQAFHG